MTRLVLPLSLDPFVIMFDSLHGCRTAVASLVIAALGTAFSASAQAPLLLTAVDSVDADALSWERGQRDADPTIRLTRFVEIDTAALARLAGGARGDWTTFALDLFGSVHRIELEPFGQQLEYATFRGRMADTDATIVLAAGPRGDAAGTIEFGSEYYTLRYTGSGRLHALFRRDPGAHKPCGTDHTHEVYAPATAEDEDLRAANPDGAGAPTLIDVCAFYTPAASSGGNMESTLAGAIALANVAATGSGIDHQLRLVYTGLTVYTETGTSTDLSRFRDTNDGFMDEVHAIRDDYGGDLMALIIGNSSSFCGVAYLMGSPSTGFRSSAFSVTVAGCISGNTLTHELGHNMGCAHDRPNAGSALYSYSYGYRTPDNAFRTIMSYSPGSRVNKWSGPNVQHGGYTMGTPTEDNARSLENIKDTVAAFKTQTAYWWRGVGGGITRPAGIPRLVGQGTNNGVEPIQLEIQSTLPGAPGALLIGNSALFAPLLGGTLVPNPLVTIPVTGNLFSITIPLPGLSALTPSTTLYWQVWFVDAGGVQGVTASHGMCVDGI